MRNLTGLEKSLREELGTVLQIDPSAFYSRKPERKGAAGLFTPTHPLSVCRTAHPRAAGLWDDAAAPLRERSLDPAHLADRFSSTDLQCHPHVSFPPCAGHTLGSHLGDLHSTAHTGRPHPAAARSSMPSSTGSRRTTPSLPSSSQPSYWRI